MPAIVGTVNVNTVSGVLNVGDVQVISPSSITNTFAGPGSFNSGDKLTINNDKSIINVYETEAIDQEIFAGKINET
jgi:spore germination protein PA